MGCQRRESPPERLRPSSADEEEEEEEGPPPPPPLILPRDEEHCVVDAAALACAKGKNQGQSETVAAWLALPPSLPKYGAKFKPRGSMMPAVAYRIPVLTL